MGPKFKVPESLEDLTKPPVDNEEILFAQEVMEIDGLDVRETNRFVRVLAAELADKEVLCVLEQNIFDTLYSLIRGFSSLDPSGRCLLIDSLCTNFVQLNVASSVLISSMEVPGEDTADTLQQCWSHCESIKIYAYFLICIINFEEAEPESTSDKHPQHASSKSRPRKKHVPQDSDWLHLRTRTLKVLAGALQNDLQRIFESRQLDERLISILLKTAFRMLENRSLLEKAETKDCREPLFVIISACTVKYGHRISSFVTILDMLHKYEHFSMHLADLVAFAESQYEGSSVGADLLRSIGQIDPINFERDNGAAENVGVFLEELANRLPKVIGANLSVVMGHLNGRAYKMRNSIVKVVGTLLVKAKNAPDAVNELTRLRSQQGLLNVLVERILDVSAHTRKHVLQTWASLAKERAIPMGHWNLVSDLAAGRLEDIAAIVRRSAVQLLAILVEVNPFGSSLRTAAFEATFKIYEEKLSEMSPREKIVSDMAVENEQATDELTGATNGLQAGPVIKEHASPNASLLTGMGSLEDTRALVASLDSAVRFTKTLWSAMEILGHMLASSVVGDVESTIHLLIICKKFNVDGSALCLKKTLPLVFSQEPNIKSAVEEVFRTLYLTGNSVMVATNLINVTLEATLGDLASIEMLVSKSMSKTEISRDTVSALWDFFTFNAEGCTPDQSRSALIVLCMAAKANPKILSSHLQNILDIGFGRWAHDDVLLARYACIALQRLPETDRASLRHDHKMFSVLANLIVGLGLLDACWFSAAEQAINAIYVLHPAPEIFSSRLLVKFSQLVFPKSQGHPSWEFGTEDTEPTRGDYSSLNAAAVSRFLFAVGHFALQHLVYIESRVKMVRKRRGEAKKSGVTNAAETVNADLEGGNDATDECFAADLGMSASEDAKLDDLAERAESEILYHENLIGTIAPIVSKICSNLTLMQQNPLVRSSATLTLCKLMVIDASFCEKHLQLLFTLAQNIVEDSVRSNCVIALGDLALRFPNLLEPWMEYVYARVHDRSKSVRRNAVLVLSHLILNDLIKVKGYISEMAMHVQDEDLRISELVKFFFNELSKKANNPIKYLLPDILSRLSCNPNLSQDQFNSVMEFLLDKIKKSKQIEGLVEKFCHRFVGTTDVRQWQDIAFCLSQLTYSTGCLTRLADLFKLYQHTLGDFVVFGHFKSLIAKTRKLAKVEVKLVLDELEERVTQSHADKREQEESLQKAQEHHRRLEALQAQLSACEINAVSEAVGVSIEENGVSWTAQHQSVVDKGLMEAGSGDTCTSDDLAPSASGDANQKGDASHSGTVHPPNWESPAEQPAESSPLSILEEETQQDLTNSTQPYPYMDIDLESSAVKEEPECAITKPTLQIKKEISTDESGESEVDD